MSTEVCLSYNQDVPICRSIKNSNDPTGCAGLCIIDQEICQKLDHQNAFRYIFVLNQKYENGFDIW